MAARHVVILGGGPGGYAAALRAGQLGAQVTLVEADKVGGVCLHSGCVPVKAFLHAAEVADAVRSAAEVGLRAHLGGVDLPAVGAYSAAIVERAHHGLQGLLRARGVETIVGAGVLSDARTVTVDGQAISGDAVIVATGASPVVLAELPFDHVRVVDSTDALALVTVPERVLIVGGGVIGCEFASMWRSFGVDVAIVEPRERLLADEEPEVSTRLERAFRSRGIELHLRRRVMNARADQDGVHVVLDDDSAIGAELVLVAVGRRPRSAGNGFDTAGLDLDAAGHVVVDGSCQTNLASVYAVGDLIAGPQLAHLGFAEGILAAEHALGLDPPPINYDAIPRITYSDPEVASVGLTSAQARERGLDVVTSAYDLAGNTKSRILQTSGSVTLVAERDGPVVGVHMVGARVGELAAEAQLITNWQATPADVARLIHPHPTQSEALGEAHLALAGRPLHAPR